MPRSIPQYTAVHAEIREELDHGNLDAIQGILYSPKREGTFDMSPAHTTISYMVTAREIKKVKPEIPVIALTAFASKLDREKALNAGCDEYLVKTVKFTFHG